MKVNTLMSGSSGNAIYIETRRSKVLIDAGQTGKALTQALQEGCGIEPGELDALFITHAHRDHIHGAGVLSRKYDLPIYATEGTWSEMNPLIGPVKPYNMQYFQVGSVVEIGDLRLESFPVSHDALEPVGFRCSMADKTVGIATDSGVFTARMAQALDNVDCLILESNHDREMLHKGPYPWHLKRRIASVVGHLSNEGAGKALLKTMGERTKKVILAHLSEENNRPELALQTVVDLLQENQVTLEDVDITIAPRYKPGQLQRI